ncbi:glycosyltransferase [Winogradskyella jejuensis]|uniref:Glycosyltransferase involved in cell wall bisynthesis n=1 Tax=Winogradskyella jejuensis TaxID=1089305 RepID=A0A1M5SKV8_9FLAO|nr:glycosyltransferase [Winogradskyella jejuensis]SHH39151.1 Glycosyltransferase involved in cell wall bisynthesis [Winogradskyella jejuensis]
MAKRIKLLYTIPNFDTAGSGKVVYDLVKHIDKTKFEPHICCMHTKGAYFKTIESLGVPIHIFPFATEYKPLVSLPFRVLKIRKFFKKQRFDIIHSWHWKSDFTESLAAKFAGVPYVYTKKAMGWGNKAWRWRSQLSTKIVTINSDMKSQFFSNMDDKVEAIPIGLNVRDFGILDKIYSNEDGYKVDKDDFVVVSIANLVAVKGIEILLKAAKQINNSKLKIFIVGDDTSDYAKNLRKEYESNQVIFTGKRQNIKSYLALADVFVIPTKDEGRKEGQPIAPIEAMLSGRVVLGSKISGIKDILQLFQDCLFQPNSVEDLKRKLEMVMQMEVSQREKLAKEMFEFASNNYTIEKSIELHETLYLNLYRN